MILNVTPEELVLLKAAIDIARIAASGYSVRQCPERAEISENWDKFSKLRERVHRLDSQREFHMAHPAKAGRKYIHVALDEEVHDRVHSYLLHQGNGKIITGALGHLVERALTDYLNRNPAVLWPGTERDADAA